MNICQRRSDVSKDWTAYWEDLSSALWNPEALHLSPFPVAFGVLPSFSAFFQRLQAEQQVHRISQQKQQIAVDNLAANFESGDQ